MSFGARLAEWAAGALSFLPPEMVVFLLAAAPVLEVRASIPLGILYYGLPWETVFAVSAFGNLVVVPFIWWFLSPLERLLRRSARLDRLITRLFERTRRRSRRHVETYQEIALVLIVAVPLPGTGVWTGALVAYLFGLPYRKSFAFVALGVVLACTAVTALTLSGQGLFGLLF